MKKMFKLLASGICFLSILFLIGCKSEKNIIENNNIIEGNNSNDISSKLELSNSDSKIDAWLVYWDISNFEEEIDYWSDRISNIIYFAAYFDENNKLFIPDNINETKEIIDELYKDQSWGNYITFVNDKAYSDGSSSLKDTDLLYELFENNESMDNHINDIISIAVEGGYKGIEIDYEKIRKDLGLWEKFSVFLEKLIKAAEPYNLPIRVLLEPSTPVDKIELPEGPEYVMMCYNLYGYGTEPGPKANKEFLLELMDKMKKVSNNRGYALATGGFDFADNGEVKAITQKDAEDLLIKYDEVSEERDEDSQCKVFQYIDSNGVNHQVWYADSVTLDYWESILIENGEKNISIWRLG